MTSPIIGLILYCVVGTTTTTCSTTQIVTDTVENCVNVTENLMTTFPPINTDEYQVFPVPVLYECISKE